MATFKEKEHQCECEECDVIITYTKTDIITDSDYDGYYVHYTSYILCPSCGEKIILEEYDEDYTPEEDYIPEEEYTLADYVNDMFDGNWDLYHDNMDD